MSNHVKLTSSCIPEAEIVELSTRWFAHISIKLALLFLVVTYLWPLFYKQANATMSLKPPKPTLDYKEYV
jgi:hypothetical protein